MKKAIILNLIVVFFVSISSFVLAEDLVKKNSVGLNVSHFSANGWKETDDGNPEGLMIEVKYRNFINKNLNFGFSVGYWSDGDNCKETRSGTDINGIPYTDTWSVDRTVTIIPILFNAEYLFSVFKDKLRPFIGIEWGLFDARFKGEAELIVWDGFTYIVSNPSYSENAVSFGGRLAGGIEYPVSRNITINANVKYQILNIDFDYYLEPFDARGLMIGAGLSMLF